jgi:hypothetical protein
MFVKLFYGLLVLLADLSLGFFLSKSAPNFNFTDALLLQNKGEKTPPPRSVVLALNKWSLGRP